MGRYLKWHCSFTQCNFTLWPLLSNGILFQGTVSTSELQAFKSMRFRRVLCLDLLWHLPSILPIPDFPWVDIDVLKTLVPKPFFLLTVFRRPFSLLVLLKCSELENFIRIFIELAPLKRNFDLILPDFYLFAELRNYSTVIVNDLSLEVDQRCALEMFYSKTLCGCKPRTTTILLHFIKDSRYSLTATISVWVIQLASSNPFNCIPYSFRVLRNQLYF